MTKAPILLAVVASAATITLLALVVFGAPIRIGGAPVAHAVAGQVALVAIDMDTTGNDDSTVGTVENCKQLTSVGEQHTFDLVVQGVDAADLIKGYQVDIDYDPAVIKIVGAIDFDAAGSTPPNNVTIISRILSAGGTGFLSLGEFLFPGLAEDTDGSYTVAAIDGTAFPAPPANYESGDGVLARITVEAVGTGLSSLIIPGPAGGFDGISDLFINDGGGDEIDDFQSIDGAAISVGQACLAPTGPVVLISALDCNDSREVVGIKNIGDAAQDMAGWTLQSDGGQSLDLSSVVSTLAVGVELFIFSGPSAQGPFTLPKFGNGLDEWFRDADTSDFAAIFNGAAEVDKESCTEGEMREDAVGGFSATRSEDGIATCNDGVDNGGADGADESDLNHCKAFSLVNSEVDSCADTVDNGGADGADTNDADCHTDGNPTNAASYDPKREEDGLGTCFDSVDNDGADGADALDPDCQSYAPLLSEDGVGTCDDGVNNAPGLDSDADGFDTDCLGSAATDGEPLDVGVDGVIDDDPVEVTVATPNGGAIRIVEAAITQSPPAGLKFVGQEVSITAPAAAANQPLLIEFLLDVSLFSAGEDEKTLRVFKGGVELPNCASATSASPDPCISERELLAGSDVRIAVLTSGASLWDFGLPPPTPTPTPGPRVAAILPPTGDSIPTGGDGGSALGWSLLGAGAAIALAAAGYFACGRRRASR